MKMRTSSSFGFLAAVLLTVYMVPSLAWGVAVEPGQFIGLFTYTETLKPLAQQTARIEQRLQHNSYLKGLTIRIPWKEAEPEEGRFDWNGLDRMIAVAHARHIYFTLDPMAGFVTPDWVYRAGVKQFESTIVNPHEHTYGQTRTVGYHLP
jgi:hypothetical protein